MIIKNLRLMGKNFEIDKFDLYEAKEDYYLTASRLVPYKKIDIIAQAVATHSVRCAEKAFLYKRDMQKYR